MKHLVKHCVEHLVKQSISSALTHPRNRNPHLSNLQAKADAGLRYNNCFGGTRQLRNVPSETNAAVNVYIAPLPHRITVTGANGLAQFVLITRRTRVQSVTRSTTLWREPHGIERITMPPVRHQKVSTPSAFSSYTAQTPIS
ncbi:hypothetical protein [Bifidobacterium breve]|uniref:hypothetical protein n=1 Tax=Bifidobacterium breve TaxID=1685 RepID=UPI002072F6EA|nr:hypothetical protein [Bifidobacterium breve]